MSVLCYNPGMKEQNESEEITPLKVTPTTVWHDNQNAHRISENDEAPRGAFTDEQAEDLGFRHPSELGESVLDAIGIEEQYPDEIKIHPASAATRTHPPDTTELRNTSDGRTWLCAIGAEDELYAKVEATSDNPANNRYKLDQEVSRILSLPTQEDLAA